VPDVSQFLLPLFAAGATATGVGLLWTGLLLGIRHGFDWDHIAAITDITSTTAAAEAGTQAHAMQHERVGPDHIHDHGGEAERRAHGAGPGAATAALAIAGGPVVARGRFVGEQRQAIFLGTLYALGHAAVVATLGTLAILIGASLPAWIDPIMGRVVGLTLLILGVWVFFSLYQYVRHGSEFRLRSRWMLVFDGIRYAWRRFQARVHGHEHVDPIEMSSYGARTAFGVGMIHGIGAETATQALLIAGIGGAAGQGLAIPMLIAFIVGLVLSNTLIIVLTATGFVASQLRQRLYVVVGVFAGVFSVVVGALFLLGWEGALPNLEQFFGFIGS
jgi:high-affinity nickel-transport protein